MADIAEKIIKLAQKGGNDSDLLIFDSVEALETKVDKNKKETDKDISRIEKGFDNTVKEIKEGVPNLDKVLESVKGEDGIQGEKGEVGYV